MIDKEAPILAFDVSKGSSHCQGYCSFGKPSSKPVKVAHGKSGMAAAEEIFVLRLIKLILSKTPAQF